MWSVRLMLPAVLALAAGGVARADTYLPSLGGDGGGVFEARCPARFMRGVELRTADDVDAIRPICADIVTGGGVVNEGAVGPWRGGTGGEPRRLMCPPERPAVAGMTVEAEGRRTVIVNRIALWCGSPTGGGVRAAQAGPDAEWTGPNAGGGGFLGSFGTHIPAETHRCPGNEVGVGVYGRHGVWLDRLGLVCGAYSPLPPYRRLARIPRDPTPRPPPTPIQICLAAKKAQARPMPPNTVAMLISRCLTNYPGGATNSRNPCVQAKVRRNAGQPYEAELAQCFASLPRD